MRIILPLFCLLCFSSASGQSGLRWSKQSIAISSVDCSLPGAAFITLKNVGDAEAFVDSVSVTDDLWSLFRLIRSNPPNRFNAFTLLPGDSIAYEVEFNPQGPPEYHSASLVAHSIGSGGDTSTIIGRESKGHIRLDVDSLLFRSNSSVLREKLAVGKVHTIRAGLTNYGNADFIVASFGVSSNDLGSIDFFGIEGGTVIRPNTTKHFTIELSGSVEGNFQVSLYAEGSQECDKGIEITIYGEFIPQSTVDAASSTSIRIDRVEEALRVYGGSGSRLSIVITDIGGRIVKRVEVPHNQLIDVSDLPPGFYVGRVSDGRRSISTKFQIVD